LTIELSKIYGMNQVYRTIWYTHLYINLNLHLNFLKEFEGSIRREKYNEIWK